MFQNKVTGETGYLRANREICPQIEDEAGMCIEVYDTLSGLLEEWEEVEDTDKPDIGKLMRRLEDRIASLEEKLEWTTNMVVGREALK